ncbi:MAG: TIR domain-containing protein [Chloroflexota bacterium]
MSLPIRTVIEDIAAVCGYLVKKPTGATVAEARTVLDSKHVDGRKLSALKTWGLLEESGGRLKVTDDGRLTTKGETQRTSVLLGVIRRIEPYRAIVERAAHKGEASITATDVASHWHEHFPGDVANTDKIINDQAVCFLQVAMGAGLGEIVIGRRGLPTRFEFDQSALERFLDGADAGDEEAAGQEERADILNEPKLKSGKTQPAGVGNETGRAGMEKPLGQAIFIGHGKTKKPLEQLKRILEQFKIPYKIAIEEPNLGRPIGDKVKEVMESCNCAILIFTADEEFKDVKGNQIWRPSENVVFELGASGYLYGNRIVIMKEDGVDFPTNFRDLGYISFSKDLLEAKAMDILKELIGFGIVKVST